MKLGQLRAAIRNFKGNPYVNVFPIPNSDGGMVLHLQKTPLLKELDRVYPGGKAVETGLDFEEKTGLLRSPGYDALVGIPDGQKAALFEGSESDETTTASSGEEPIDDDLILDTANPITTDDDLLV